MILSKKVQRVASLYIVHRINLFSLAKSLSLILDITIAAQPTVYISYCSLRAQCMIATSNCVPCDGVSKQSLHSVIVISGTMKVSLSLISRGQMLRLMVLTLYFDLYYSGYHKNLIQQLCAPLCELSVCGRCLRWHTNIYKLVGFLFFLIWGPLPFHPYLSGEPRLSQQHRTAR